MAGFEAWLHLLRYDASSLKEPVEGHSGGKAFLLPDGELKET